MSENAPALPPRKERPHRLWVPGRLFVSDRGELCTGSHVGYGGPEREFRHAPVGRQLRLTDWTHTAWLVDRASLQPAIQEEHAIILPEQLVDRDAQPYAHRWLAAQPLLCVSGLKEQPLIDAGVRVFRVEFGVAGDGRFELHADGGRGRPLQAIATAAALQAAEQQSGDPRPSLDRHSDPSLLDRLLRQLSAGVLTEPGVVHALAARSLVEDGYGYRGQQAGDFKTLEAVARDARALNALFEQIYQRADRQREDAKRVRSALPTALVDADEVAVPLYGRARRVAVPAMSLPAGARGDDAAVSLQLAGEPQAALELPAMDRWFVDGFEEWHPTLPPGLARELGRAGDERDRGAVKLAAFFVLLAALVAAAVVVHSLAQ